MIQFDQVSLSFAGHCLFEDASFTLQKGERCGLVGRNGSGKSTLLRLINQELEPDRGSISIPKNYRLGYLQQHIRFAAPSILEETALGLRPHEKDHLYKAEAILFGLGFTAKDLSAPPSAFSGGFQLRLHLAKVLVSAPDCLLLDEPTNYLDILSIRWLLQFLSRWEGEFLLITHDRDFMDRITTHTMGIHREKLRKIKGTSLDFYGQLLLEEEIYEKTRVKIEKRKEHLQSYIDRFGAKASKASQAQSKMKALHREPVLEKLNQLSQLCFSFHEAPFPGKKLLDAKNLKFSYTEQPLIEDVSFEIEKGERLAIIGKNGRGKSTLLRLLSGEIAPLKGSVALSENVKIGYFGQTHIAKLKEQATIEEEIGDANLALNRTEVKKIAGVMMFSGFLAEKKIALLSGGERSRVLLGKILAKPCNLLLLDEPTHHLDIESIEALIDALEDFNGSVVIVTHSELILRRLQLNKIVLCDAAKQLVFLGTYDAFLEKHGWLEEKRESAQKSLKKQRPDKNANSSALKLLEKQIQVQEQAVIALEEELKKSEILLERGEIHPDLLKTYAVQKQKMQEFDAELYALYELLEQKKKEMDKL